MVFDAPAAAQPPNPHESELLGAAPAAPSVVPRRPRSTWKRLLAYAFLLMVGAAGLGIGVLQQLGTQMMGSDAPNLGTAWKLYKDPGGIAFVQKDRLNILCLGLDYNQTNKGIRYTKWVRTDTIFVVSVEKSGQHLNVLSIPRDMRVAIDGYGYDKINAAFATKENGNVQLTRRTVEQLLHVPIDEVVVIREYAAQRMVDALGGVTVDVEKKMDYDDNWGDLHIHLKPGVQRLNGKQAVGFIRFRHDDEGDRGRIRRQQQFMNAMLAEVRSHATDFHRLADLVRIFNENVQTTMSFAEIADLGVVYHNFDRKKMVTAKLDGADVVINGGCYIQPDDEQNRRIAARLLCGDDRIQPADIRLEILNASTIGGAAGRLADEFRARGFQVVRVGNSDIVPRTQLVDHQSNQRLTRTVAALVGSAAVRQDHDAGANADVTIVLGKDWANRKTL
jgi:LCP family protein required for cell wall assembly